MHLDDEARTFGFFEDHLYGEVDPATAVRSVFGPWLDHATPPEREALVQVLDGI